MINKFLVYFTFIEELTFPPAYLNMDFWTSLSFITNKIAHLLCPFPNEIHELLYVETIIY